MPTVNVALDAFRESPKHEFFESPKHERNDEASLPFSYSFSISTAFCARYARPNIASFPSGATARGALDETFRRLTVVYYQTYNPDISGPSTFTYIQIHLNEYTGGGVQGGGVIGYEADSGTGTGDNPNYTGYSFSSESILSDSSSAVVWERIFSNGTDTITETYTLDQPVTFAAAKAKVDALYAAKYAAWQATGHLTVSELWEYDDSGTMVENSSYYTGGFGAPAGYTCYGSDDSGNIVAPVTDSTHPISVLMIAAESYKFTSSPAVTGLRFYQLFRDDDLSPYGIRPGTAGTPYREEPFINATSRIVGPGSTSDFHEITPFYTGTYQGIATSQPP